MMTSRFAVGSVSTFAMGALLLGSASFLLNRPGNAAHATPWGDIASLSPASSVAAQADDKSQLLKLAALKSGTDTAPAAMAPAPSASQALAVAPDAAAAPAAPALIAPGVAQNSAAPADPAAATPPVQMAAAEDQAPTDAPAPAADATAAKVTLVDLNTASADSFDHMGAGRVGRAIVAHRPYRSVKDLVNKRVLRTGDYQKIESRVRVD